MMQLKINGFHLFKKFFFWFPVYPVVSFFWLGKVKTLPEMWLGITVFLLSLLVILLTGYYRLTPYDWAALMLPTAVIIFILGYIAVALYMNRSFYEVTEITVDQIAGNFLALWLVAPAMMLGVKGLTTFFYDICEIFVVCNVTIALILAIICAVSLPFFIYYILVLTKPWPTDWIDKEMPNATGVMIDDIVIAFYTAFVVYFIYFIPFNITLTSLTTFMEYTFTRYLGI